MASRCLNRVMLIGNLGANPEVRYTQNGNAIANASLATTVARRDKESGEMNERTEWHRIVFFNRLAEIVGEFLKKGSKVFVEGSLRTRKWTDKTGVDRFTTEVIASEMLMLDSRGGSANANIHAQQSAQSFSEDRQQAVQTAALAKSAEASQQGSSFDALADDDIPF
jgi:single-strand DNA-binding protein